MRREREREREREFIITGVVGGNMHLQGNSFTFPYLMLDSNLLKRKLVKRGQLRWHHHELLCHFHNCCNFKESSDIDLIQFLLLGE